MLEEEALDLGSDVTDIGRIMRQGSTSELALLVAEFGLLDEQLVGLAAGAGDEGPSPAADELMGKLAVRLLGGWEGGLRARSAFAGERGRGRPLLPSPPKRSPASLIPPPSLSPSLPQPLKP